MRATLAVGSRLLRGALVDVSASGARVLFEGEDYRSARPVLSEALYSATLLHLSMNEGSGPVPGMLVWYGVAASGGFAIGVEFAVRMPAAIPARAERPAEGTPLKLFGVRHRASRQARLALSLRDLFVAIGIREFDLDSALHLLCEKVRMLTGAEGVTFWALRGSEPYLRAQAGRWSLELGCALPQGGEMLIPPFPILKEAVQKGHQLFSNDASSSLFATHPGVQRLGLRSIMIIPVFGREVDFGMLILGHSSDPYAFGAEEQTEAEIFANQAALFFEKAQLLESFRESTSFFAGMNRIALAFHERLDVDRVLEVICRESRQLFGVDLATIFLCENGTYTQRASSGMPMVAQRIAAREFPGPEAALVDRGEAFFLNDFDSSPLAKAEVARRYRARHPVRSLMVIPIRYGSEVLGTLTVADRIHPQRFSSADLDKGKLLGEQAALAIINARLYERVAQSKLIIRQQDRFRIFGELAGVISHEIKNALVPLRTLVDLLPHRYDDPDFRDWFARVVGQEVERMHGLVGQLSRFRSANRAPELTEPTALVRGVVELINPEAKSRRIELVVEGEALPPILIVSNELRQVLLNLILNAIQAVEEKGTVRVGVRRSAEDGATFFSVSDTGPGVGPDALERIFDPLYTTKENGSGLGLAIARDLAQANGGSISVESSPDAGATFTVVIPAPAGEQPPAQPVH